MALTGIAFLLSGAALADAAQARATAAQHAGFAAGSEAIARVRLHLQHSLNCLVGPDAEDFDETAGYPCAEAGAAIPQTPDAGARESLQAAVMQVKAAMAESELAAAQSAAGEAQAMLAAD